MICPNCGANISENTAVCPYCGSTFEKGQELKYMEDLERVRKDTESIAEESEKEYKKAVKSHARLIIIITVAVIFAAAGLFMYSVIHEKISEAKRSEEIKKEIEFRNMYFSELDALYESGDDEALAVRINELMPKEGSGALFDWKHYKYYICYEQYQELKYSRENIESGHYNDDDLKIAVFSALTLLYDRYYAVDERTESPEKMDVVNKAHEEARAFLSEELGYTIEEEQELLEKCSDEGYISYSKIDKTLPEIKERVEKAGKDN